LERLTADTTAGTWQARELNDEPGYANVLVESAQTFGGFSSLFSSSCCGGNCFGHVERAGDATWIATMSPAVASPLVEWLRTARDDIAGWDSGGQGYMLDMALRRHAPALRFARLVLGEEG
jgi:hypothetical protein